MNLYKLFFAFLITSILSCSNDNNPSNDFQNLSFPITYTLDTSTDQIAKLYTKNGEVIDQNVINNFIDYNSTWISSFGRNNIIVSSTFEFINQNKVVMSYYSDDKLIVRNFNVIKLDGVTYLEEEDLGSRNIPFSIPLEDSEDFFEENEEQQTSVYKYNALFEPIRIIEAGEPYINQIGEEVTSGVDRNLTKETFYLNEIDGKIEFPITDILFIRARSENGTSSRQRTAVNNSFDTNTIEYLKNTNIHYYRDVNGSVHSTENIDTIPSDSELFNTVFIRDSIYVNEYKLIFSIK